mmetsp:Transcript_15636/g.28257  ORF Transcript_15636/g.28257 Transcript_15636/m.28257 type:complete len:200 (+) Transcript_15636:1755-2354(+)
MRNAPGRRTTTRNSERSTVSTTANPDRCGVRPSNPPQTSRSSADSKIDPSPSCPSRRPGDRASRRWWDSRHRRSTFPPTATICSPVTLPATSSCRPAVSRTQKGWASAPRCSTWATARKIRWSLRLPTRAGRTGSSTHGRRRGTFWGRGTCSRYRRGTCTGSRITVRRRRLLCFGRLSSVQVGQSRRIAETKMRRIRYD